MTIVKFKTDPEKELEYFDRFVKSCGTSKLKKESLELISLDKKEAIKRLEEGYKKEDFIQFVKDLKKEWKKIEKEYFQKVKESTGLDWQHERYICYVSLNVPGLGDLVDKSWDKVILSNILPANIMKYVLAHELFHLHYFYVCKKEKMPIEAASVAINESIPILFMLVNPDIGKLFPEITVDRVRKSYQEVDRIIDKLIDVYKSEKNFIKLINKAIEIDRTK